MFNKAGYLGHVKFLKNKVFVGFLADALVFQIHCSSSYQLIIAVTLVVGICLDGDRFMSIEEGLTMASATSLHSPLLPSTSGTPPFLRRFSFSGVMLTLVRMHVPGAISLVRVHGAMGFAGLLGWVSLIDCLCCSWEDLSRGHRFGRLELCWEGCVLPGSSNTVHRQSMLQCNCLDMHM